MCTFLHFLSALKEDIMLIFSPITNNYSDSQKSRMIRKRVVNAVFIVTVTECGLHSLISLPLRQTSFQCSKSHT